MINSVNPPPPVGGASKDAQWLNQLRAFAISLQIKSVDNGMVSRGPNGTLVTAQPGSASAAPVTIQLMQVISEPAQAGSFNTVWNSPFFQYLTAQFVNATGQDAQGNTTYQAGNLVTVAKPFYLRTRPFTPALIHPAYVQSRAPYLVAPPGSAPNTPAVAVPQFIWAVKPAGGTGVFVNNVQLDWLDLNVDGRSWGYPMDVCPQGVAMKQIFVGSIPYLPPGGQSA